MDLISVKEFSEQNGLHKQTVFKVIKRLGIEPEKSRGGNEARGQMISYITKDEAKIILEALSTNRNAEDSNSVATDAALYDVGVFYLLRLEPEHDPNRFKVGFANNFEERLRQHRCSAPFAEIVETWPCRRLWEKTAIEAVTQHCKQLHTEVFRAPSLDSVKQQCEAFFKLMPKLVKLKPKNQVNNGYSGD